MTISTKVDAMTKNDIISIIKYCHKHQVKRLVIDGLELEFPEETKAIVSPVSSKRAEAVDEKDLVEARQEALEHELDTLSIENPEAWLQGMLDGSLAQNDKAAQV